jgi:hypothetical protein
MLQDLVRADHRDKTWKSQGPHHVNKCIEPGVVLGTYRTRLGSISVMAAGYACLAWNELFGRESDKLRGACLGSAPSA